jgi:hypothetical protein
MDSKDLQYEKCGDNPEVQKALTRMVDCSAMKGFTLSAINAEAPYLGQLQGRYSHATRIRQHRFQTNWQSYLSLQAAVISQPSSVMNFLRKRS